MNDKKKCRITLKQIAEKTGFAVITVSKALRNEKDIAASTKEIICKKAQEMGYVPNFAASSLLTMQSRIIAVNVVNIANPYWSYFCDTIENLAYENGYSALFFNAGPNKERELYNIETMIRYGVDGVLLDPSVEYDKNIARLDRANIPVVLISPHGLKTDKDTLCNDNEYGGYLAGKLLIRRARKKILFLDIPEPYAPDTETISGLRRALNENDFPMDNFLYDRILTGQGAPRSYVENLMKKYPGVDAIVAFNDWSALEILDSFRQMGIRVPEDVAIIAHDNIQELLKTGGLRLTTVEASPVRRAEIGFNLLMRRIEGNYEDFPMHIKIPVTLIEGETC